MICCVFVVYRWSPIDRWWSSLMFAFLHVVTFRSPTPLHGPAPYLQNQPRPSYSYTRPR
jgi:hypothetical protein